MRRDDALKTLRTHHADIKGFGVHSLILFGSTARDEARPDSDVDILVEFRHPVGYFALARLSTYLEQLLGSRVDLVTAGALTEHLREQIQQEAVRAA